jgi:hypothetical protein
LFLKLFGIYGATATAAEWVDETRSTAFALLNPRTCKAGGGQGGPRDSESLSQGNKEGVDEADVI